MKGKAAMLVALLAALGAAAGRIHAQKGKAAADAPGGPSEKTFAWDDGPDTIDVSKYPAEQQANYKIFVRKCSKCHTLSRPINSPYALPEEWEPYVAKMQKKRRSGLDAKSAKRVLQFLIFDSGVRKQDLIQQRRGDQKAKAAQQ